MKTGLPGDPVEFEVENRVSNLDLTPFFQNESESS